MFEFLIFACAVIGLTNIMVVGSNLDWLRSWINTSFNNLSKISEPTRFQKFKFFWISNIKKIFSCYQCMGTWCGFACGLMLAGFNPISILLSGFAGSFLAVFGNVVLNYLEAQTFLSLGDKDE